jgi:hypothetical protein
MKKLLYGVCAVCLCVGGFAQAQNALVPVSIDVSSNRHAINPLIYGTNLAGASDLASLKATSNRWGGNESTRYNWRLNATNYGTDWYFESIAYPGSAPAQYVDSLITQSIATGAQPMVTIPMIGWVANLGTGGAKMDGFSVAKYGAQCASEPYGYADAGDGLKTDCVTPITGNNPNDADIADSLASEQAWVQHMVATFGGAAAGGVGYYILDNEQSSWYDTHRDVHPVGPHATEILGDTLRFANMIHAADPAAKVVAPEEWGWWAFQYSGYDQQYAENNNYCCYPDQVNQMGGKLYYPWLLSQWKLAGHPVDVVSAHYYPSDGEYSNDVSPAMQTLRNVSTRELWDKSYQAPAWGGDVVALIPTLTNWVNKYYYSGTPIAITEYNWGADNDINGATAQADILGIFGQQGVAMANRFGVPAAGSPTYKAIQMYRNYDGQGSGFADTSVKANAPNPDQLSVFAAQSSTTGFLTIMVINKIAGATPVKVSIGGGFTRSGSAQVYQLTSANAITQLPNQSWTNASMSVTVPSQSITLYVLP